MQSTLTLLQPSDLADPSLWRRAQDTVRRKGKGPGPDGVTVEVFCNNPANLEALRQTALQLSYAPWPGKQIYLAKQHGGERPVKIDCVGVRVFETGVNLALREKVGQYLSSASYAYREGTGALRAAHGLVEHRKAGRKWVLRGDIAQFFDSVPHDLMLGTLSRYVSREMLPMFARILRSPVLDGPGVREYEIGLAQGSVLAPIFANLYLNPFDHTLSQPPAGLVRFSDDFALAAPSARMVGELLERAETILNGLRLRLNDGKTRILSFAQGFDFLGFRFQGESVRVSPERIEEFKAHLEHLLTPRFGTSTAAGVREANHLIQGWRNYFQLGEVAQDFRTLDQWMQDRFGGKANDLERLVPPDPKRPVLGGYVPKPKAKFAAPVLKPAPQPVASTKRDETGKPVAVNGQVVADLSPAAETPHTKKVVSALERTGWAHRALVAGQWGQVGQPVALKIAAALAGRTPFAEANQAYEQALFKLCAADPRPIRGSLRRALRLECWTALLEAGLPLGPEDGGIPNLAHAMASAFEALTADFASIKAIQKGQANKPLPNWTMLLGSKIHFRAQQVSWQEALRLEAALIAAALRGEPYVPFMWGSRSQSCI